MSEARCWDDAFNQIKAGLEKHHLHIDNDWQW
jgi:hypothetical protein